MTNRFKGLDMVDRVPEELWMYVPYGPNGMDLREAEDIKKRWQESTEELYENGLHDPDNHDGVITHLEPDILECKSRKSRVLCTNRQIWPWSTKRSRSKANRVLPRECTSHSKNPLPKTQEKTLHMDITRWSTPKSD